MSGQTLFSTPSSAHSSDRTNRGTSFRIYAHVSTSILVTPRKLREWGWFIQWIGIGQPQRGVAGAVVPKWSKNQDLDGKIVYYSEVRALREKRFTIYSCLVIAG